MIKTVRRSALGIHTGAGACVRSPDSASGLGIGT
jgi:hypothetical protein